MQPGADLARKRLSPAPRRGPPTPRTLSLARLLGHVVRPEAEHEQAAPENAQEVPAAEIEVPGRMPCNSYRSGSSSNSCSSVIE